MVELVRPSFEWAPPAASSKLGGEAVRLAAAAGLVLDPWQAYAVERVLAEDDLLRPAALEAAVVVARQNGKGGIIEACELAWLFLTEAPLILHTCHEFKALDVATPIFTTAGWSTMGELRVGDEVFAPDGQPTKVVGAYPWRSGRPCYRLRLDDGQEIVADAEHLWAVEEVDTPGRLISRVVSTADMVSAGMSHVQPGKGRDRRTYRWRIALPAALQTVEASLPVDSWLLGAWLGDGTAAKGELTVGSQDLPYILESLDRLGETYRVRPDRRWPERVFTVIIAGLAGRLRELGVLGAKHIPAGYLLGSAAQRLELLRGVMDTDGTVSAHQVAVTMTNARLMDDVATLVRSLGVKASLREFRAAFDGRDAGPMYRVQFAATQPVQPFGLPRKAALMRERGARSSTRSHYNAVVAVDPVATRPTRCITVSHESGCYLAGRGLVPTHNTAQEAFLRMRALLQGAPDLWRRVTRVTTGAGTEGIELSGGQRLRYVARSAGSGRGFTGGKLVLDEAFALDAEEMAALLPTLTTQPEAQLLYTSTAGMSKSSHMRRLRDRGRAGGAADLCYLEWGGTADCPDDCVHRVDDPGCELNDRGLWREANPAWGIRVREAFLAKERGALPPEVFAREVLGVWDEPAGVGAVPLESWQACADLDSAPAGRPVFAVDAAPGSRSAAIVAALWRADGLPHLEVVAHAPGTEWVPGRCAELRAHRPLGWVLDPASPVGALLPDLARVGVVAQEVSGRELGLGCEGFARDVAAHAVVHLADPVLARAVAGAGRRDIGDGLWAWSRRRSEADISPLVAATLALWALRAVAEDRRPPPAPQAATVSDTAAPGGVTDPARMGF